MLKSTSKRGRPKAVYHPKLGGDPVVGLMRLGDGRWRASGPDKYTFSEADEKLAIAHFRAWEARKGRKSLGTVRTHLSAEAAMVDIIERAEEAGGRLQTHTTLTKLDNGQTAVTITDVTLTDEQWAYVRKMLIEQREWVAQRVGIEQIAYLPDLKKPAPSPTLDEVGKTYSGRHDLSEKESQKVEATWDNFSKGVGVRTLRDLTPELVATWGLKIKKDGFSAKTVYHYYNRVKTVLNHFRTTGRSLDDVRHALDCCAVLKAPETTSLDPHPIAPADFAKLLAVAGEGEEKALLLVALNLCFYPIDLARVRWKEIDLDRGVYHAKRGKTKVARCGVLWSRTINALKALSRSDMDDYVFHKENGHSHTDTTVRKWFFKLRERAKVSTDVQFADIRDGSFTEAVAGEGVEFQHAQILAGHRSGIADAYVLRNPRMVAKACAAVERAYFD